MSGKEFGIEFVGIFAELVEQRSQNMIAVNKRIARDEVAVEAKMLLRR